MFRMLADGMDLIDARSETLSWQYTIDFKFDWNDYRTIKPSTELLKTILPFIEKSIETKSYVDEPGNADDFGVLCAHVGTYFNHVKGNPEAALPLLKIAENKVCDIGWTTVHLAFTYQQMLAAAKKQNDQAKMEENYNLAISYCDKAITGKVKYQDRFNFMHLYSEIDQVKIIAFSHCVQALAHYEMGKMTKAIATYRTALDMYEKNNLIDDQYARAKNRWAMMLAEDKQLEKAEIAFSQIKKYWDKNPDQDNIYIVRFYSVYNRFLQQKAEAAQSTQQTEVSQKTETKYSPALFAVSSSVASNAVSQENTASSTPTLGGGG